MFANKQPSPESSNKATQDIQRSAESIRLVQCAFEAFSHHQSGRALRYLEQAVGMIDRAVGSSVDERVAIRTEVVHPLVLFNEPAEAERYLREAFILLATDSRNRDAEVQHLRAWSAEVMLRSGNLGGALETARSVFDWTRSNYPHSLLEVRALLVESFVAAQRGTAQEYGGIMARVFGTIAVMKVSEMFELSQVLASFSAAEEAQGRFGNAKLLADAALKAYVQSPEEVPAAESMLRAHQAEMVYKTGDFSTAKQLQAALLKEVVDANGAHDPFALQVRISLAESHIEMSEFEAAENHLRTTFDTAKEHEVFPLVWRAADVLSMLYVSRGMEEDAKQLQDEVEQLHENLSEASRIINQADGAITDKALHGDPEGSLSDLEELFERLEEVDEDERAFVEASLLATKAWLLSSVRPEEGRQVLNEALDRLAELPPGLENSLRVKIAMTQAQLAIAEEKPEIACTVVQEELSSLVKREGEASFNARGALLHRLAVFQEKAGRSDEAAKTARELVSLYSGRGETGSIRYAHSLVLLARLLPTDAHEKAELVDRALQLLQRRGLSLDDM